MVIFVIIIIYFKVRVKLNTITNLVYAYPFFVGPWNPLYATTYLPMSIEVYILYPLRI